MVESGQRLDPPGIIPSRLAQFIERLPQWPHSAALAAALNLTLLPELDADMRRHLAGRSLAFQVRDLGIDCRVRLIAIGFIPAARCEPPAVAIRADAADYWRLARRVEDPDTLFFARRLLIEGDTELGLGLKNTLDGIDWTPARRLDALVRAASAFFSNRLGSSKRPSSGTRV